MHDCTVQKQIQEYASAVFAAESAFFSGRRQWSTFDRRGGDDPPMLIQAQYLHERNCIPREVLLSDL